MEARICFVRKRNILCLHMRHAQHLDFENYGKIITGKAGGCMSHGRRKIYTEATEITASNVVEEVNAVYLGHSANCNTL